MNASLVVLGVTMVLGSVLISGYLADNRTSKSGFAAMAISGAGVMMVGFFPENSVPALHELGAAIPFTLGNASLVILAFSLRGPAVLRVYSFLSGVLALLGLAAYTSHHYLGLGEGGMERVVAYPQTVFLIVLGCYLTLIVHRDGQRRDNVGDGQVQVAQEHLLLAEHSVRLDVTMSTRLLTNSNQRFCRRGRPLIS